MTSPRLLPPACLAVLLLAGAARAQLPHIRLDSVFPLGGAAGSDVLLDIGGKDLDGVQALRFDHPGLTAELVKPNQFRVRIAADVPEATYEVRAVGAYGISGSRLFAVSRGLAEVAEKEPNDTPDKAQAVPLNCAVNGHSDGNGDDFFRFRALKGRRVVLDCRALRLDSTLRASLVLSTAEGKVLALSKPYYDRTDPLLDFTAPADGDYVIGLHDMTYNGGLPYRLVISDRPQIENVFPAALLPGETAELTVLGRNLPGGRPAPGQAVLDQSLDQLTVPFTMPRDPAARLRLDFLDHPASPSLTLRGLEVRPRGLEAALNPAMLVYADHPVVKEREPNDSAATAQAVPLPAVICGRFDQPGDADWYSVRLKAGETISLDLWCERLGLPGDPFIIITDAKGQEVGSFDDHGINFNALTQFNRDPFGSFTAPAAGTYHILVQERYNAGGPRYQYVLSVGKPEPDFYPVVVHETNPDPSCPVVRRGGSAFYEFCVNRHNLSGPVTVEAEGLPKGVTCPPVHVSPQTEFGTVVFTAAADAPEWAGAIRLEAWAMIDGKRVERPVRCAQRRWPIANINTARVCREICLAVRSQAPYGIRAPAAPLTVAAGGKVEAKVTVERQGADFRGKVQLAGLNLPPGFEVAAVEVPADRKEATVKLTVAGNVPPGTYSVVLRGDAQVPFSRDPKAATKPNVRVADPSTPLTVVVTPARKNSASK
ncbi:MAG TPA: PPC domain-containing protein [Gemmataceae bacterium]|nr:PPC domain-containing protein [Gemmataceae bacterium]